MTGVSALLGALGLVGIVFGLLSFALAAVFGAPSDAFLIGANLLVGFLLLGFAAVLNFDAVRERLSSGEARRAGKYGTSAILTALISIAILGLLGFLAERHPLRFDWSEAKVHSLSDQSQKVLDALESDVHAVAFFSPLEVEPVRELLDRYAYASDRFRVEYVDPSERPDLLERYQVAPEDLGQGLVRVAMGEDAVQVSELSEENITNAMVKLSRTGEKQVYFLEGHNERAIEGEHASEREAYARAADALRNENYRVSTLLLAAEGEVPEDADVVVVAGATRPLLGPESAALERYLRRGGALLALVDPRAKTDLVDRVREWGVDLGDDVVVAPRLAWFGRPTMPFVGAYAPDHEITKDLRERALFDMVRSVRGGREGSGEFTEIVFTGDDSWAERDLQRFFSEKKAEPGPEDLKGPVPIAVAGRPDLGSADAEAPAPEEGDASEESEPAEPRLVVFGDSDFASNELIEASCNRDLFVNSVNWLLGDVEAISIRPARSRASRFQLSAQQFVTIRSLSLFVLPEAIAVLGVVAWWRRRQAPGR